jgi:hypothetical protein
VTPFIAIPKTKKSSVCFVSPWFVLTAALLASAALVHAQNPMLLRWDKAAPFPEPEEELYGVQAGGKMENGGLPDQMAPATADHSVMEFPAATGRTN